MEGIEYLLRRHVLADGEVTTLYAVRYPRQTTHTRVVYFPRPERLDVWCRGNGVEEAVVGGFFLRDPYRPLGELWLDGRPVGHEPVAAPYAERRGSVVIDDGDVRLMERGAAPEQPAGDLVQAGPLLVVGGASSSTPRTTGKASPPARGSSTRTSPTGATRAPPSASRASLSWPSPATAGARTSTEGCRCSSSRR